MLRVASLMWALTGTVFAGIAIVTVLAVPTLASHAMSYIPYAALGGMIAAIPVAFLLAWQLSRARAH